VGDGDWGVTPNAKVTRSALVRANASSLAGVLERMSMDTPPVPVRILFEPEGVSCWTLNAGKTVMLMMTRWEVDSLRVKEPSVIVCDPKELASVVRAKGRDGDVQIKTEASAPIVVTSPTYGGAEVMPADENDCLSVPDRNQIPVSTDGVRLFPMFDMAPATWSVDMPIQSLRTAVAEMAVSKAPYSVLSLRVGSDPSEARSGHWGAKQTRSWTPIEATPTSDFTVSFTDTLSILLGRFDSQTTQVRISKHEKGAFVVIESLDGCNTVLVATEAKKET